MKAIVSTKYGSPDVLQLAEVPKPAPKDDEVLVKIHAASVNPADWHFLRGKPFPVRLMATDGRESDVGHPDGETDPGGLDLSERAS
jgi:NADPH:quinone reductase-like Zn-dependent oxidoreductase